MRYSVLPVERRCDMAKKKKDLPVFTIVELPEWKNRVLDFMLQVLNIPGSAWVVAVEDSGFNYDGEYYEDKKTGIKLPKKMVSDEQGD